MLRAPESCRKVTSPRSTRVGAPVAREIPLAVAIVPSMPASPRLAKLVTLLAAGNLRAEVLTVAGTGEVPVAAASKKDAPAANRAALEGTGWQGIMNDLRLHARELWQRVFGGGCPRLGPRLAVVGELDSVGAVPHAGGVDDPLDLTDGLLLDQFAHRSTSWNRRVSVRFMRWKLLFAASSACADSDAKR